MRFLSEFVNFLVNRCPSCGLSAATICARCWFILNEAGEASGPRSQTLSSGAARLSPAAQSLLTVEIEPFVQRVLYLWDDRHPRPANVLREVILTSKEHPSQEMMRLWAGEIYRRATLGGLLVSKRDWILIPPPGRSGLGEEDHAGAMARELSAVCGGALTFENHVLERVGLGRQQKFSQKTKSRTERSKIEFRISIPARKRIERAAGFIFIDDVIATGATAKAAWIALGKPRAFESWAIALKVRENPLEEVANELRIDTDDIPIVF